MYKRYFSPVLPILLIGGLLFTAGCDKDNNGSEVITECIDGDGNIYETVKIGGQLWMAENLRTTTYNDGTNIPNVEGYDDWSKLETDAFAWYNNNVDHKDIYGAMYNWYAVETGKLCPYGWRVPTDDDWMVLSGHLGDNAGGKLKATGTIQAGTGLWYDANMGATNEAGFSALPGGSRNSYGTFGNMVTRGYWWSSTQSNINDAWNRSMRYTSGNVYRGNASKISGFSIRCVRE